MKLNSTDSIEIYSEIIKSHLKNLLLKYNLSEYYEEHTNTSISNKKHIKNTDFNINILSILDKEPFLIGPSLSESLILLEKSTELWMSIIIKSFYSQDREFDHVFQLVDLVSACKFIRISSIFELILVLFSQLDEEDLLEIELFVFNSRLKRVFDYNKTRLYDVLHESHRGFKHGSHVNHASHVSTRVSFENLNKEKDLILCEDVRKTRIFSRTLNNSVYDKNNESVQTIKSVKTKENHENSNKIYNKKIITKENHENQRKNIRIHRNIELNNKENIMNMSNISRMTFSNTNTYTNTYISTEKTEKTEKTNENQIKTNTNQSFSLDFEPTSIKDNSLLNLLSNSSLKEHLQVIDKDYKNNHIFCIVNCISLSSELKAGSKLVVVPLKEVFTIKEKGLSKKCLDEIKEVYNDIGYIPYWMIEEFLSFFEKGEGGM